MNTPEPRIPRIKTEIGWREMVGLPGLGIHKIKAKIDTGARTGALHATDITPVIVNGAPWVRFNLENPVETGKAIECSAPVHDHREIRNSSGGTELRYVIKTMLVLSRRRWQIELSLTNRELMGFDLIIGRAAIKRHAILVNPGKSFLAGPPGTKKKKIRKKSKTAGAKVAAEKGAAP